MSNGDLSWIANYIWGIADDVLRDVYVRGKYRDVILPMTVLRRLDTVLEDGKQVSTYLYGQEINAETCAVCKADPLRGRFAATVDRRSAVVEYEPDPDLRDTEQVPLQEEGGIEAFLRREALPFAPDAWYRPDSVKIGYEVSFNRYFYKPQPRRGVAGGGAGALGSTTTSQRCQNLLQQCRQTFKEWRTPHPTLQLFGCLLQ